MSFASKHCGMATKLVKTDCASNHEMVPDVSQGTPEREGAVRRVLWGRRFFLALGKRSFVAHNGQGFSGFGHTKKVGLHGCDPGTDPQI